MLLIYDRRVGGGEIEVSQGGCSLLFSLPPWPARSGQLKGCKGKICCSVMELTNWIPAVGGLQNMS